MAVIGYARVSTGDQNPEAQVDALRAAGAQQVFVDYATGSTMNRSELRAALDQLQRGDTLMVCALDRFGRSLPDLVHQMNWLNESGVTFVSLREAWDTTTPVGRLLYQVSAAFAEFERAIIVDRTRFGMAAAARTGKKVGRPALVTPDRARIARQLRDQGMPIAKIAKVLKVSDPTARRCLELSFSLPEFSVPVREAESA